MKITKLSAFILFIIIISFALDTGCKKSSSDNSNPTGPLTSTNSLVGTWGLSKITVIGDNNSQTVVNPKDAGVSIIWTFRSDNTAQVVIIDSSGTNTENGTYSFANNTLSLKNTSGQTQTFPLTFISNTVFTMQIPLTIDGTDRNTIMEFTKQSGINPL